MKKLFICLCVLTLAACTDDGEIYDSKKHKKSDFSAEKTVGGETIIAQENKNSKSKTKRDFKKI